MIPYGAPVAPTFLPSPADRLCGIGDEAADTLAGQITAHVAAGFAGLELRTIDGCGLHELPLTEVADAAERITAAGLVVPVVDTPVGSWSVDVGTDLDDELRLLSESAARARLLGCRALRVMSYPNDGRSPSAWRSEALRRMHHLADAAAGLGVVLLHENCHGWAGRSAARTIEMLELVDNPHLRLVFDIGNGLAHGYDPLAFLDAVLPWVDHVHVKDGVLADRSVSGDPTWCLPGEGDAPLIECVELLEAAGYEGWYSIEPHISLIPHLGQRGGDRRAGHLRYATRFTGLVAPRLRSGSPTSGGLTCAVP